MNMTTDFMTEKKTCCEITRSILVEVYLMNISHFSHSGVCMIMFQNMEKWNAWLELGTQL